MSGSLSSLPTGADAPTLPSGDDPPTPGSAYLALRTQAIRLVQAMSDDIWTDYNFSDPGVTILEQLCYALTELPYRAGASVPDLLSAPDEPTPRLRRHGLLPVWSAYSCNPVTPTDLRRLLLDRVPGLANVWFTPLRLSDHATGLGLYDVAILPLRPMPAAAIGTVEEATGKLDHRHERAEPDASVLLGRVRRCYEAHRALCEDLRRVHILQPLPVTVTATMLLARNVDPSDTLAHILFTLGLLLAPEPKRQPLDAVRATGAQTADIFTGPLMLRGFITDDQLQPLAPTIQVDTLIAAVAEVAGVLTVDAFTISARGQGDLASGAAITIPPDRFLALHQPDDGANAGSIQLRRAASRLAVVPARVNWRLRTLWRQQRRTYPLRTEYAAAYGPPPASYTDPSAYTSVQTQFPDVYGINATGLPAEASDARQAMARQLKGYLMPFDQLLADYFSQLALLPKLFSASAGGHATYAWQSLAPIVPDAAPLLRPDYETGMASLVAGTDPVDSRRQQILDLLLSFYGLRLDAGMPVWEELPTAGETAAASTSDPLIKARQALLRALPGATRDRGRGADPGRPFRPVGAATLSRIQLGLAQIAPPPQPARDEEIIVWIIVEGPDEASFGQRLRDDLRPRLEPRFRRLDPADAEPLTPLPTTTSLLEGHRVARPLAGALGDPDRYRLWTQAETMIVFVVCIDDDGAFWILGGHESEDEARRAIRMLLHAAERRPRHVRQPSSLFLVDWIQLRFAHHVARDLENRPHMPDQAQDDPVAARYRFHVTAVLPHAHVRHDETGWREQAEAILRQNIPAHVVLDCLFLGHAGMERFRRLYDRWVEALRQAHPARRAAACFALQHFLEEQHAGPPPPPPPAPEPPTPPETPTPPGSPPSASASVLAPAAPVPGPAAPPVAAAPAADPPAAGITDAPSKPLRWRLRFRLPWVRAAPQAPSDTAGPP